jgi:hypothetical protein
MTETTNIIQMPEPLNKLAADISQLLDRVDANKAEFVELTMQLAAKLKEARDRFPNNQNFRQWLFEVELIERVNEHDRAALINMGRHPEIARIVLQETDRRSWRLIWEEEIQPRLGSAAKKDDLTPIAQIPIAAAPESPPSESVAANPAPIKVNPPPLPNQSALKGLNRADEVYAIFQEPNCRVTLVKAIRSYGGSKIWNLVLQAIDAGFLTPTQKSFAQPNLGFLFPNAPQRFRNKYLLTDRRDLKTVEQAIMPAAIANQAAILAAPENIETIIRDHEIQLRNAAA